MIFSLSKVMPSAPKEIPLGNSKRNPKDDSKRNPFGISLKEFAFRKLFFYPFTPPEVSPDAIFFCNAKKMIRMGSDTKSEAAANTGQFPLVSVACNE